jgi:glutamate---cysteine ligase / carboxylate-amine ligase
MSQCLVEMLNSQIDKGYTLPMPKSWTVRENKWRAARYGVDAEIIVDDQGSTAPLRDVVLDLVDELMPFAERLDCTKELARARDILETGPSYARQRAAAARADGDLRAVVDALVGEMRSGVPNAPSS